jgi:hypothetical protein
VNSGTASMVATPASSGDTATFSRARFGSFARLSANSSHAFTLASSSRIRSCRCVARSPKRACDAASSTTIAVPPARAAEMRLRIVDRSDISRTESSGSAPACASQPRCSAGVPAVHVLALVRNTTPPSGRKSIDPSSFCTTASRSDHTSLTSPPACSCCPPASMARPAAGSAAASRRCPTRAPVVSAGQLVAPVVEPASTLAAAATPSTAAMRASAMPAAFGGGGFRSCAIWSMRPVNATTPPAVTRSRAPMSIAPAYAPAALSGSRSRSGSMKYATSCPDSGTDMMPRSSVAPRDQPSPNTWHVSGCQVALPAAAKSTAIATIYQSRSGAVEPSVSRHRRKDSRTACVVRRGSPP